MCNLSSKNNYYYSKYTRLNIIMRIYFTCMPINNTNYQNIFGFFAVLARVPDAENANAVKQEASLVLSKMYAALQTLPSGVSRTCGPYKHSSISNEPASTTTIALVCKFSLSTLWGSVQTCYGYTL